MIVLMAGFDIDANELRKMSWLVTRLAVLPCVAEAVAVAAAAYFLMDMPLLWGSLLG